MVRMLNEIMGSSEVRQRCRQYAQEIDTETTLRQTSELIEQLGRPSGHDQVTSSQHFGDLRPEAERQHVDDGELLKATGIAVASGSRLEINTLATTIDPSHTEY